MKIDTKKIETVLTDKTISAYRLSKEIGIPQSTITRLRKKDRSFKNITVETLEKVQVWIDKNSKKRRDTYLNKSRATSTRFIRNRKKQ